MLRGLLMCRQSSGPWLDVFRWGRFLRLLTVRVGSTQHAADTNGSTVPLTSGLLPGMRRGPSGTSADVPKISNSNEKAQMEGAEVWAQRHGVS